MVDHVDDLLDDLWSEMNDLESIMEEPPGSFNHGREKISGIPLESLSSEWMALETDGSPRSSKDRVDARKHGTSYTYRKFGCRCEECRLWKSSENRKGTTENERQND